MIDRPSDARILGNNAYNGRPSTRASHHRSGCLCAPRRAANLSGLGLSPLIIFDSSRANVCTQYLSPTMPNATALLMKIARTGDKWTSSAGACLLWHVWKRDERRGGFYFFRYRGKFWAFVNGSVRKLNPRSGIPLASDKSMRVVNLP